MRFFRGKMKDYSSRSRDLLDENIEKTMGYGFLKICCNNLVTTQIYRPTLRTRVVLISLKKSVTSTQLYQKCSIIS